MDNLLPLTPIELIQKFLNLQTNEGREDNQGYSDTRQYQIKVWEPDKDAGIEGTSLILKDISIGFSFDKEGNFLGIYNYKD